MIQKFNYNSRAMEAETISKNAVRPKSRKSRGNVFSIFKTVLLFVCVLFATNTVSAQARLTVENNSKRTMTVKVMRGNVYQSELYTTATIYPNSNATIYFSNTGYYFCKTKAVLGESDPVYQKGQPFYVVNDDTGYSVMTLTFTIVESTVPQVTGGERINKAEFDKN
jgi:hypothetical protein